MEEEKFKQMLAKAFRAEEEKTKQIFQDIFSYPFHPDMRFLLFEIMGDSGSYGINLYSMIDFDEELKTNAKGESLLDLPGFVYVIELPKDTSLDLLEGINGFLVEWFTDQFHQAGGVSFSYPCYLMWHDHTSALNMAKRIWVDTEEMVN